MTKRVPSTLLVIALVVVFESFALSVRADCGISCDDPCCIDGGSCTSVSGYDCPALWTVRADAVALHRDRPAGNVLFENAFQPVQNLTGSDFNFGYEAGVDLSLIRHLDCLPDLEFRYLKVDGWNSSANTATNYFDPLRINTATPVFLPSGRTIDAADASRLDNFELNFRRTCDWLILLAGFRYIEIDEDFHADLTDTIAFSPTVTYDTTTQNRLYGAQLGAEAFLWQCGCLCVDAVAKGAIFHNSGRQNSVLGTTVFRSPAAGGSDGVSLLGEANLTARYSLSENLSLRGGYGLLAINGLVLATEQVNATSFAFGNGVERGGTVFYHGAFLGLEYIR